MSLDTPPVKRMRLRYTGTCRSCGATIEAGQVATYDRADRAVECLQCPPAAPSVPELAAPGDGRHRRPGQTGDVAGIPDPGTPGASAWREHDRRVAKRDQRVRAAHPHLGGFLLAVSDEPSTTTSWAKGAPGEEKVGAHLDALAKQGVRALHDRRVPGSLANIDHIAISAGGVWVIDAKRYKNKRPHLKVTGGFLFPRVETLVVDPRDCTKLLDGMDRQLAVVRTALGEFADAVPVTGVLCFVDADWPLFGGSFTVRGIPVVWPKKLQDLVASGRGLDQDGIDALARLLAAQLLPA